MLAVVEGEDGATSLQALDEVADRIDRGRPTGSLECGLRQQAGVRQTRQLDPGRLHPRQVEPVDHLSGQARLADAAWAGDRHEPVAVDRREQAGDLDVAPDHRVGRRGRLDGHDEPGRVDLQQADRAAEVAHPVLAGGHERGVDGEQRGVDGGVGGHEHLPCHTDRQHPGGVMEGHADRFAVDIDQVAAVHEHAHLDVEPGRPPLGRECALRGDRSDDGVGGAVEQREAAVSVARHGHPTLLPHGVLDELPVPEQQVGIPVAGRFEQRRGRDDVGEEDRPCSRPAHGVRLRPGARGSLGPAMDGTDAGDERVLAWLREVCLGLPETSETRLQGRPLFVVRRRRFALLNGAGSPPRPRWDRCGRSVHLLTEPAERGAFGADPRFTPSPHHGDRGWFAVDPALITSTELAELLDAAYRAAAPAELVALLDQAR